MLKTGVAGMYFRSYGHVPSVAIFSDFGVTARIQGVTCARFRAYGFAFRENGEHTLMPRSFASLFP